MAHKDRLLSVLFYLSIVFLGILLSHSVGADVPEFIGGYAAESNEGYHTIQWSHVLSNASDGIYELQRATVPSFTDAMTIYTGRETQAFVSGLLDGSYYYRVRTVGDGSQSQWSVAFVLTIQHYGLVMAWSLFAIGALIFLAIITVLVVGVRKSSHG